MKPIYRQLLIFIVMLWISAPMFAYNFTYDGLIYKWIVGDNVRLYGISKLPSDGKLVVPEKVYDSGELQYVDGISDMRNGKNIDLLKNLVLNDNIDYIEPFALVHCDNLIRLEYNVRNCGFFATLLNTNDDSPFPNTLSEVEIGENVEYLPKAFISRNISVSNIQIPNSVTTIGNFAFMSCTNLNTVVIGERVNYIGRKCFAGSSNLQSITSYATTPPQLFDENVYDQTTYADCNLFVPAESVSLYKEAVGWKNFYHIYSIGETPVENITLNQVELNLCVGEQVKLSAIVEPESSTNTNITWSSDNEVVATVGADGTVTAVSVGVANITATCGEATATCKVTVNPVAASGITLGVQDMTLLVGQSDKLTATVSPENTTDKAVTWNSDNEAVATVGADGTVTAVSVGVANITATCGEATATCKVTVNPVSASGLTLSVEDITLLVGQSDKLTATVQPENTTDKTVSWSSDNEAIANIGADGTVTAVSVGVANITATCGEATASCKVTVNPIKVSSIELSLQDVTLLIGSSTTLTAKVYPENATEQNITWSSSDPSIASVDNDGTILALQIGETTITATCGKATATCKVTVTPVSPSSIELNIKDMVLFVGQSETIQAIVRPANTTYPTVTWRSDDETVAIVTADGKVTGIAEGITTITATCGEISASCKITINPIPASNIEIITGDVTLTIGSSTALVAKVSPDNTTHPDIDWSSSDTNIATITAEGKVTAVNVGTAIITAKCGNMSATCTVTVIPVPSEGIVVSPTSLSMLLGEEATLSATVFPENTTDKTVTWGSDNSGVASVSSTGVVSALGIGTATITASNGSAKATCFVTVNPVVATSIALNVKDETIFVASTTQLIATISPSNVTDKTITWTSSKPEIATVDEEGVVLGIAVGTTTITATCGNVSATCQINVVHRIPDMDPVVTTSGRDISTLSGRPVNMAVYAVGGEPTGWSYVWTKNGEVISKSSELNITAKNEIETVIAETYRVKVENEIDKVVILSEVFDFIIKIYPDIDNPIGGDGNGISISTGPGENMNKTREGNTITLSVATPKGGNQQGWEYVWKDKQGEISDEETVETVANMSVGNSMAVEESPYYLELTNYSPDGDVWGRFSLQSTINVYRRPQTPVQMLRKGDGTSYTFVAMMPMNDTELERLAYTLVYGWTDSDGADHIIEQTNLRYCHIDADVYDNLSNKFWVYSVWNYQDGCIVSSGLCYLDGTIDENFDASVFDGSVVSNGMKVKSNSAVYSIDGHYMGNEISRLTPGIYIYKHEKDGEMKTEKIIIR